MADAGSHAHRTIAFIGPKRRLRVSRRRTSPVTSSDFDSFFVCPVAPLFTKPRWRSAAKLLAAVYGHCRSTLMSAGFPDTTPRQIRMGDGCRGREDGLIGRLIDERYLNRSFSPDGGSFPAMTWRRPTRIFYKTIVYRVTTPVSLGAFFRNEEGREILPPFQGWGRGRRMRSLLLKKRWPGGPGWFPLPCAGEVSAQAPKK